VQVDQSEIKPRVAQQTAGLGHESALRDLRAEAPQMGREPLSQRWIVLEYEHFAAGGKRVFFSHRVSYARENRIGFQFNSSVPDHPRFGVGRVFKMAFRRSAHLHASGYCRNATESPPHRSGKICPAFRRELR
jgi:hypothetical protein